MLHKIIINRASFSCQSFFFFLFLFCCANMFVAKGQEKVTTAEQLEKALNHAGPGTHIVIGPGTYENWSVTISRSGTKENPLVISGAPNGQTVFSGDGGSKSFFSITGDYV